MTKKKFASLTALGGKALPPDLEIGGQRYVQGRVFKDDFFAITALYEGQAGKVILKIQRQAPFLLIPMHWIGRYLARRELSSFERLCDVEGVPSVIAPWGTTGLVRTFVEGHPLARGEHVADDFHARLRSLIGSMHDRGMAYVDLEKSENVLVGEDGRPHLFDFQISWQLQRNWGGELWPMRMIRNWLQRGDLYHLRKLQRRTRPDQLSPEELALSYRRPWHVRVHRFVTYPFTWCRRCVLDRIDPRHGDSERGRVS